MKPEVDLVMQGLAFTLLTEVIPDLHTEYSLGDAAVIAAAMLAAAQEYDRAADIRAAENAEMRALFAEAARMVEDTGLRARLTEASGTCDASLRVSSLNEANDRLKALLIELQAHVEESRAGWAPALEKRIWDHLVEAVGRRRLPLPVLG
jgi:hypothetical protein